MGKNKYTKTGLYFYQEVTFKEAFLKNHIYFICKFLWLKCLMEEIKKRKWKKVDIHEDPCKIMLTNSEGNELVFEKRNCLNLQADVRYTNITCMKWIF